MPGRQTHLDTKDEFIGTTLNRRYRLATRIGEGAAGVVYTARPLAADARSPVVVKIIKPGILENNDEVERVAREYTIGRSLLHPHLVKYIDHGVVRRHGLARPYLVMEFVNGTLLASRRRLSDSAIRVIAQQVLAALRTLHGLGLVHRDVKPENVVCRHGRRPSAVLLDLGIVKDFGAATLTKPGHFLGTLRYGAPEAIAGDRASPTTDYYALGGLMYDLLAHPRRFFDAFSNRALLIDAKLHGERPSLMADVRAQRRPAWLCQLVDGMTLRDRATRIGDAELITDHR